MLKTAFCRNFKGRNLMAKEMIAMILAGGQGSRLYALTQKLAKPAVPFGGKYRIIDFPLSNCVNSGIDTVGILTQLAISSGVPPLLKGIFFIQSALTSSGNLAVISVIMNPGATALALTPRGPSS